MRYHHTKTDAELKAAISRFPDRRLKTLMASSKKRKHNSDDETDDKWAKYKKFLVTYALETLRNNSSTLQPVSTVPENEDNMTEALTELIKSNLALLSRQEIKSNEVRLTVAERLIRLNEIFDNGSKGDFYQFVLTNFGISKR
ncbi:hypothetical protein HK100_001890 [Physocladia obscura]|uniref:Uncharacterized protein n=1 Tax=Physocladia obscura TaxID=109957 RepID=A0AAD5SXS5_9FUNG|nr:hypothetical protein HK100_001890 [Physocladia obscura]